ncbi:MAG: 30S ribosomal protein S2 [Candidatus Pacebacteria bacterium]|nr:30S ribosomal protein S2 [Candidatus Paceibacterota bacterium]
MLITETNNTTDTKIQDKNQEEVYAEIESMYRAGVHFGYSRSSSHPKMKPYFFGLRNNVQIFNLEKTYFCLGKAVEFAKGIGASNGKILFVATKPEIRDAMETVAREIGMPFVAERWLGGTLTNFEVFKKQISALKGLRDKKAKGDFAGLVKKEIMKIGKKIEKMEKYLEGLEILNEMPKALLVIDPKKEKAAVLEARKLKIPVIAILNSDCNPVRIDYPIPGNDASESSVKLLLDKIASGLKEGVKEGAKAPEPTAATNS